MVVPAPVPEPLQQLWCGGPRRSSGAGRADHGSAELDGRLPDAAADPRRAARPRCLCRHRRRHDRADGHEQRRPGCQRQHADAVELVGRRPAGGFRHPAADRDAGSGRGRELSPAGAPCLRPELHPWRCRGRSRFRVQRRPHRRVSGCGRWAHLAHQSSAGEPRFADRSHRTMVGAAGPGFRLPPGGAGAALPGRLRPSRPTRRRRC